jgi:hypothetical protein
MKTTLSKLLAEFAVTSLLVAGSSNLLAENANVFSTFDTDLSSLPWGTNYWGGAPGASLYFTNAAGNPSGAMVLDMTFAQGTAMWQWQDYQAVLEPFQDGIGLNMGVWDYVEFDVACETNASILNLTYANSWPYGGIGVIGQGDPGWGNNSTNIPVGDPLTWHQFGVYTPAPATNGWFHVKLPVGGGFGSAYGNTLNRWVLQCFQFPDTNQPTAARILIDNFKVTALQKPPTMSYVKAVRGLNIWATSGGNDRNSIRTYQDQSSPLYYMWANSGAASYSFTLTNWPSGAGQTAFLFRMNLIPSISTGAAADWDAASCIMMELGAASNGIASWMMRWKTNAPGGNGQYYDAGAQVVITNPTPLGKWTLSFDLVGTGVTMTAPGGDSTNFVMGVHPNVPDLTMAFMDFGVVYLGLFGGSTNDLSAVLSEAQISGLNITSVSNNWMTESILDPFQWVPVAGVPWSLVPTNNSTWVRWTLPDGGFALQTNAVDLNSRLSWSTNHGLPSGTVFPTYKAVLVKPGDLPNTPRLFYRMSSPGF